MAITCFPPAELSTQGFVWPFLSRILYVLHARRICKSIRPSTFQALRVPAAPGPRLRAVPLALAPAPSCWGGAAGESRGSEEGTDRVTQAGQPS